MGIAKFTKQPAETQDYDFDFQEYLEFHNDVATAHVVTADPGLTVGVTTRSEGVVKAFISGGVAGNSYKVSATITTAAGRIKQGDILVRVKEL